MTYCCALKVNEGIIFCSDSRTNAGIDHVSTYSKMYSFGVAAERQVTILSAGNLATTQAVIAMAQKDIDNKSPSNLLTIGSLRDAAEYLGQLSVKEQEKHGVDASMYDASFIIGGQIGQFSKHEIFLVYPEGNYISTSDDTPFLQIGESKYGKPILDRIITPETSLSTAASAALVSMDSTMKSNLTVGPPIEVTIFKCDTSLQPGCYHKFDEDSAYLRELKKEWDKKLREAFKQLPPIEWSESWDQSANT